jgi:predicted transcriptional regulator
MTEKNDTVLIVRLPSNLKRTIASVARDLDLTSSDIVRTATEAFVAAHRS